MLKLFLRYPFCFPALMGVFFGFSFPVLTILFMLYLDNIPINLNNIISLHSLHKDLFIIWSAPIVIGLAGSYIGKIHWMLRRQMRELSDQTIHLNTVLNTAASGIISIDRFGIIMNVNREAEQMFGYAPQEIVGHNIKHLMPEAIASQHDAYLQRYAETHEAHVIGLRREVTCLRKNGEEFPALLRVNIMSINGEHCFTGVIDDISETRALETQLTQAQKLEAIGQLASGVAHEINTPIQFIGDNLSALQANLTDIVDFNNQLYQKASNEFRHTIDELSKRYDMEFILDDSPKAVTQALEGVERVSRIVSAMKSFSHVESGSSKQSADLHQCLLNALTLSRNTYKYIAAIETDFSEQISHVDCYPNELSQVFLNLIVNAAHAIEDKQGGKGLIKITTRPIEGMTEILIQDNGKGIAPSIQDKVFNLFFTTKEVGRGTGQGLSLAHNIVVEKHKGRLFFETTPEVGTTFHVQLPLTAD